MWAGGGVVQLVDTRLPKLKFRAHRGRPHPTQACHQTVRTQLCHVVGGGGRGDAPSATTFLLHRPILCSAPWTQTQYAVSYPQGRAAAGHALTCRVSKLRKHYQVAMFSSAEQNLTSSIRRHLRKRACPSESCTEIVRARGSRGSSGTPVASVGYTLIRIDNFFKTVILKKKPT